MEAISRQSRFFWVGNWLAVDFINTAIVVEGRPVDFLRQADDFMTWLSEAGVDGVAAAKISGRERERLLPEAKAYRSLLKKGIAAVASKARLPTTLIAKTNALLARPESAVQLVEIKGSYSLAATPYFTSAESCLVPIAQSMAKLLVECDPNRLRKCRNPECVLYYYDTSKSGTRSWCSLDICGNKLRMAASRQKREV